MKQNPNLTPTANSILYQILSCHVLVQTIKDQLASSFVRSNSLFLTLIYSFSSIPRRQLINIDRRQRYYMS